MPNKGIMYGSGYDGYNFVLESKRRLREQRCNFEYEEKNEQNMLKWGKHEDNMFLKTVVEHVFPSGAVHFMPCSDCPKVKHN